MASYFKSTLLKSFANNVPLAMAAAADAVSAAPKKAPATKKPKTKPAHPKTSDMVMQAVRASKDRKGSSLVAIKKSIAASNKIDVDKKLSLFIRKFLKKAVADGLLIQVKGTGASGSFKLPAAEKAKKAKPAASPKKAKVTAKKAKATTPKKPKAKAKKATKSPKKPKAPKPKKAVSKPKAKKAAPKKK